MATLYLFRHGQTEFNVELDASQHDAGASAELLTEKQ